MLSSYAIAVLTLVVAICCAVFLGLILLILFQTAFQNKRMNDENVKEVKDYRATKAQQDILKDQLGKENFVEAIKDVLDKGNG